jgi:ribonuclease R
MVKKNKIKQDPYAEREAEKYANPIPSREFILEFLAERGQPATRQQLIAELNLETEEQQEALRRRLIAMLRDGQLLENRRGALGPLEKMELVTGVVIGHKDGFGFVTPIDGGEDLFLGPRQMRMVFHGDKVLARVSGIDSRGRREGFIVEVLEHNTQQLAGRFFEKSGAAFVEPVNKRMVQDILIPPHAVGEAKDGQMVIVGLTSQPTARTRPMGEIVEILGDHMAPGMEIDVAIRSHDLPRIWPEAALAEAARYAPTVPEEACAERVDLRHLPFVTIDGDDAKDFDDAVYCFRDGKSWKLYVAIADVSHYVKPGTALDEEALKRGNSVYFPGRVIPMLPEVLSNNLCSLNPHVDRLVMVCEMTINDSGKITRYDFCEAVIKSHARLTYADVHAMIEKRDLRVQERFKELLSQLGDLYDLFHILRQAREKRGAIDFNMPETKIVFGSGRKIERIVPAVRYNSHRVIEECMLCANISTARFLVEHKHPSLFRVHQGPKEEKLNDLRRFLNELGLKLPGSKEPVPGDYAELLRQVTDRPDAHLIQTMLLRSMSQAIYSPENKGHFGLAYEAYTHFTSPIRRYPDLLVHRAIRDVLRGKPAHADETMVLEKYGQHCSMTERRADDATSEAVDWLKCEFMMDKVGDVFDGVISSVTSFGFFVELADIYVEGLVHISTLPNDYYQYDLVKQALQGGRSNQRYRLGDKIKIKVARVDLDQREMDFVLATVNGAAPDNKTKKKGKKKRGHR